MRSSGMPQWNVCDGTVPVKVITKNICIYMHMSSLPTPPCNENICSDLVKSCRNIIN